MIWRHAWRNALFPVLTLFGLWLPILVTGAVFVESVFAWPGLGSLAAGAIGSRDYPLLMGTAVLAALVVVLGGLAHRHRLRRAGSASPLGVSASRKRSAPSGAAAGRAGMVSSRSSCCSARARSLALPDPSAQLDIEELASLPPARTIRSAPTS